MSTGGDRREPSGEQPESRNEAWSTSDSYDESQPAAVCQALHAEGRYEDLLLELSGSVPKISYWHARKYLLDIVDYFLCVVYQGLKPVFPGVFRALQTSVIFMKTHIFLGRRFYEAGKLFVSIYVDFLALCLEACRDQELNEVITVTKDFLQHVPSSVEGRASPVNLSVTRWLYSRYDFLSAMYAKTTIFFIQRGADVNDRDCCGDTPLHIAALARRKEQEALEIAQALFERGVHLDQENARGMTPLACSAPGQLRALIQSFYPLPLSCLAAQAVRRYNLPCSRIPVLLNSFVWDHEFHADEEDNEE